MSPVKKWKPITHRINQAFDNSVINQAEFAKKADVSEATISRWLSGATTNFDEETRKKIARILHINIDWLETGQGPMHKNKANEPSIDYLDQEVYRLTKLLTSDKVGKPSQDDAVRVLEIAELMIRSAKELLKKESGD